MMKGAIRTATVFLAFAAATASAQTPAGGEFRVNTYTTGRQSFARPAMEPDGDFVIVWESDEPGGGFGAFGQRFAASGAPRGGEFRVNTYTVFQNQLAVAVGRKGDFVVVWESTQDGSGRSIQGRRFAASGSAIGGEFLVNSFTTGNQYRPNIGRAADGRFVVCWTSQFIDGNGIGIAARRFDASGNPVGSDFLVNTYTTAPQNSGSLAVDPGGNFVVVWEDYYNNRDGSGSAVFGQRYDASGNRLGSEFQVNSYTTGTQFSPSVSVSPAGGFAVVWASHNQDGSAFGVFSRRFDASGNALGSEFLVNTYTTGNQFGFFGQIAHDVPGNFVVTWMSSDGSVYGNFAQRFTAAGARRGAEFQANSYTTSDQLVPSIASDAVGNFVIAWDSYNQDGSNWGTYAQRFGGLFPTALRIDTAGNGVWEPGETLRDLRPTWRNHAGSPQGFTGTLSNITAPAGVVAIITDSSADYGTVADNASGECTITSNCYSVSNTIATRPTTHIDASALESLAPDVQGQQKMWLLHIGNSFTDVPASNGFYRFIETLLHYSITGGCGGTDYCPSSSTTREQMAVFVLIAKEGAGYTPPACATPVFNDVPASSGFCRFIEELFRRGVVNGCGNGNYCPSDPVTREQMAVFALRTLDPTLDPPACTIPRFTDVPASSPFCKWIEELARRGVVSGCGGTNYCPAQPVTREQMGVFISATFGLTLYGP